MGSLVVVCEGVSVCSTWVLWLWCAGASLVVAHGFSACGVRGRLWW